MRILFWVLLPLLSFAPVYAGECTIYGRIAEGAGHMVGVYTYDDYITNTEKLLGQTVSQDSGKFQITIEVDEITWVYVKYDNLYGFVFATPGKEQEVFVPAHDPERHINADVLYEVPLTIWNTDSTDMNFLATDFNAKFDLFWKDNFMFFVAGESAKVLDSFHVAMDKHYTFVTNPYFRTWMDYSFASFENATFQSERRTALRYLVNKPIQYRNNEYMGFFNNFFKDFLYRWSMKKQGERIWTAVNKWASYDSLMSAMRNLPWVQNDTIRELVLLKGLTEIYQLPAYDPRNIISIAQQVIVVSKISEHRRIARNIVSMYTRLRVGSIAPLFTGINTKGEAFNPLEYYKGKYIYLFFFASWNVNSVKELRYMAELQKKYGKTIMFVSVSLDEDTAAWKKFMKENPKYNWLNLHYNFQGKTKEDYNLYGVPAGFVIDPEGRFYISPADNPSGDLEYALYRIVNPKKPPLIKPGDR